eukprot:5253352-Heterocapsa_arctica.AAC.1
MLSVLQHRHTPPPAAAAATMAAAAASMDAAAAAADFVMLWTKCRVCNANAKGSTLAGACDALLSHANSKGCIAGTPHTYGTREQDQ